MSGKKMNPWITMLLLLAIAAIVFAAGFLYWSDDAQARVSWRIERGITFVRGVIDPAQPLPTAIASTAVTITPTAALPATATLTPTLTLTPQVSATITLTPTLTLTPTPIAPQAQLPSPAHEKQTANNCGPATLAMYLRYWGWQGDQTTIADKIKPLKEDRNVNVEELVSYILTDAGWLEVQFRVGGDIDTLKRLVAAGYPVMIEESMILEETSWPGDDHWAGHYLLINGYDDATQTFLAQDSFRGADQRVPYSDLDKNWKAFNRVYLLVFPPEQQPQIKEVLGSQWDVDTNRQHALDTAQSETDKNPTDAFEWFNLGTNLVYFEKYQDAARAYDKARDLGLPQRMLRYQFGPFFAYFHIGRNEDLLALADYALKRTPNAEEAMLWKGWALYRLGRREEAMQSFNDALVAHPSYSDAQYALNFVQTN